MVVLGGSVGQAEDRHEPDVFPLYPCIQPNVNFWLKVYTQYSSDQGVIHDKRQMDRIYGIIALVDPYRAGGRKINNKRIKAAKKKYKAILSKLMQGKPPAGAEELRVAEQFGPDANAAVFRSAMRNLRCQTGQKNRFREGTPLSRSTRSSEPRLYGLGFERRGIGAGLFYDLHRHRTRESRTRAGGNFRGNRSTRQSGAER